MPSTKPLIFAVALMAAASTNALAAEASGTILSIDKAHDMIRLSDGKSFLLPEGIEAESLSVGEHVKISYVTGKHKVRQASVVTRIK